MNDYRFTSNWFDGPVKNMWEQIIPQLNPTRILEVGSYEGASTCFLIDKLASEHDIELHCVDSWEGGITHQSGGAMEVDMNAVEENFRHNTELAISNSSHRVELVVHKEFSDTSLSKLIGANLKNYFDFVYIDGSHEAPDVLCDAVQGFRLLRIGGLMAFDDYLWSEPRPGGVDHLLSPKPAIDAFVNIYIRKLKIVPAPQYQLYVTKTSD
jgi:predicted O-methyltransferase YrrM